MKGLSVFSRLLVKSKQKKACKPIAGQVVRAAISLSLSTERSDLGASYIYSTVGCHIGDVTTTKARHDLLFVVKRHGINKQCTFSLFRQPHM